MYRYAGARRLSQYNKGVPGEMLNTLPEGILSQAEKLGIIERADVPQKEGETVETKETKQVIDGKQTENSANGKGRRGKIAKKATL